MTSFPRLPTFEHLKFYYEDIANSRITRIVVTRPREKGSDLTLLDIEHEGLRTWRINKLAKSIYNHIDGKPYLLLDNAHISSGAVVRILNTLHWLTRLRLFIWTCTLLTMFVGTKGLRYRVSFSIGLITTLTIRSLVKWFPNTTSGWNTCGMSYRFLKIRPLLALLVRTYL